MFREQLTVELNRLKERFNEFKEQFKVWGNVNYKVKYLVGLKND